MNIKSPRRATQSQPHIIRHIKYIYGNSKERRETRIEKHGPINSPRRTKHMPIFAKVSLEIFHK